MSSQSRTTSLNMRFTNILAEKAWQRVHKAVLEYLAVELSCQLPDAKLADFNIHSPQIDQQILRSPTHEERNLYVIFRSKKFREVIYVKVCMDRLSPTSKNDDIMMATYIMIVQKN